MITRNTPRNNAPQAPADGNTPPINPTVLAFERKLDPSDALFAAGLWDNRHKPDAWQPIGIREKAVLGTFSHRPKTEGQDPAALDSDLKNPNPQKVDIATLPDCADTLRVQFTLRVLPGVGQPSACNNIDYRNKLIKTVDTYLQQYGMDELARRYAHNLANGRFLWRNRLGAEAVCVRIEQYTAGKAVKTWDFDNALELSLGNFPASAEETAIQPNNLSDLIAQGLMGTTHVLLHITAYARIGVRQEVYPSQEMVMKDDKNTQNKESKKSKFLYSVSGVAAIHSQKIGNALRTIDTWYSNADEAPPIAVEPYGSVTKLGTAYRRPSSGQDFYTLLDNWILRSQTPAEEQQHFVIATLIRGGVFGG